MKKNLPITDKEIFLAEGEEIISTTDLKGCITSVNDVFVKISGFSREELLGKNHNIVRHPDMPVAAFQNLWDDMKEAKHWLGIVKNRCKNGDFYWVDAFVTPIVENAKVVGYESVRVKPKSEERQRAERLYKNINAGMSRPFSKSISIKSALFSVNVLSALVIGAVAIKTGAAVMPIIATSSVLLAIGFAVARVVFGQLDKAAEKSKAVAENLVSQYVYTGRTDNLGQIIFGGYMLEARLRTIVGRMTESFTALHWN